MTIHTLKPDNQVHYVGNEALYDEWYQTNLHLSPAQVQLNHHTYNDNTGEITFRVRPTNEEVTATTLTPPPWAPQPKSEDKPAKKKKAKSDPTASPTEISEDDAIKATPKPEGNVPTPDKPKPAPAPKPKASK